MRSHWQRCSIASASSYRSRSPRTTGHCLPLEVVAPDGCLVNAQAPSAMAAGNVETSQRIVDTVLGALAQAIPEIIPAASSGTMNNTTLGGIDLSGAQFAYYETVAGGMGARPYADGLDATHTHMTNSLNTPVEALEHAYPYRVARYEIRRGSGGTGTWRGGDGIRRDIQLLVPAQLTILSDRRIKGPYGLQGGGSGRPGRNVLISGDDERELPGKVTTLLQAGDIISVRTPGGGGFGAGCVKRRAGELRAACYAKQRFTEPRRTRETNNDPDPASRTVSGSPSSSWSPRP